MLETINNLINLIGESVSKWFALFFIMIALETIITIGFFIWLSLASLLTGLSMVLYPTDISTQIILFSISCIIVTLLWWKIQYKRQTKKSTNHHINNIEDSVIGKRVKLKEKHRAGRGTINILSTVWSSYSEDEIKKGKIVEVTEVNGIVLTIKESSKKN